MIAVGWLAAILVVAGLGWAAGLSTGATDLEHSAAYQFFAAALLAVGLYGSTSGIHLPAARKNFGAILFATTVGVLIKAVLVMAAVYYLIDPAFAIVGLAVAQIDPLAVAAMLGRSGMSERAKAILRSWASFDDPVTALLTIYAVALFVADDADRVGGIGALSSAGGIVRNVLFVGFGLGLWWLLRSFSRWTTARWSGAVRVATLIALVGLLALATANFLMFGVAVLGLFFRPRGLDRALGWVVGAALLLATFALGLLLADGIALGAGAALGLFAFGAQMIAAAILPARLSGVDRVHLALGQQNGITAIVLALALEPLLPGTVAMVAPAVLVVNSLHVITNAWWDLPRRPRPPPTGTDVQVPASR